MLDAVTLSVVPGTCTGLVGPNGCGKTTLFDVMTGFVRADSGALLVHGQPIGRPDPPRLARQGIARTFQECRVWQDMSVVAHVLVALRAVRGCRLGPRRPTRGERAVVRRLMETVGLDVADADTAVGTMPSIERRRVELARALALDPSVLLVDEISAGLNPAESRELLRLVAGLRRSRPGLAVILVEHKLDLLFDLADRIVVMSGGRVHADGDASAIRADPASLAPYLGWLAVGRGTASRLGDRAPLAHPIGGDGS